MLIATIEAVCVGAASRAAWVPKTGMTAIDKRPVAGRIAVDPLGFVGDTQVNRRHHGGPDRAVYAYGANDADYWVEALGVARPAGSFGENLRVRDLDVSQARIGDRWIGDDVELEVSGPRTPCRVFAGFWDHDRLVDDFLAAGRPGAYLRVVRGGTLAAGDTFVVRPADAAPTVADVMAIITRQPWRREELAPVVAKCTPNVRAWYAARQADERSLRR